MTIWRQCFLKWSPWFMAWSWYDYHVLHDSCHIHGMIIFCSLFFFLKKTVRVGFCLWAIELARVMRKKPHFGVGIVWGAFPSGLPVFPVSVSGCSWNSHGTSPNLWVQKKLVKFRQCTQDTWLCFAKFLREFLGYSPLDLLGDLGNVILS